MQQLALIIGLLLATVVMALPGASMNLCIGALRDLPVRHQVGGQRRYPLRRTVDGVHDGDARLDPRPLGIFRAHGRLVVGPVQNFHRDLRSRAASIPDLGHLSCPAPAE